jgi:hypothetical protein
LRQDRAALAFAEHGHGIAAPQRATRQDGFEGVDPGGLEDFLQHGLSGSGHNT